MTSEDFAKLVVSTKLKNKFGNLSEIWTAGNTVRRTKGLPKLNLEDFLESAENRELIKTIKSDLDMNNLIICTMDYTVWAHLSILLLAASTLDSEFKFLISEPHIHEMLPKYTPEKTPINPIHRETPMTENLEILLDAVNDILSTARKIDARDDWRCVSLVSNETLENLKDAYTTYIDDLQDQYTD